MDECNHQIGVIDVLFCEEFHDYLVFIFFICKKKRGAAALSAPEAPLNARTTDKYSPLNAWASYLYPCRTLILAVFQVQK